MSQQPRNPQERSSDLDHHMVLFPTRSAAPLLAESAARAAGAGPPVGVGTHTVGHVVVLEVAGILGEVVEDLDRAIQLALADGPRGVVCDLTDLSEGAEPGAVEILATAGRHVRDWPGIPVGVACSDRRVRGALAVHPLGGHLIVTASLPAALSAVEATPALAVERIRLAPHPTAPRASRDFVKRTLLDWRLGRVIRYASLVVSEIVMSSTVSAGTDLDVSIAWNLGALRLTVRDFGQGLPPQRYSALGLHGRELTVVAGLSRAFGVLPTADGGKVVWAVLEAPAPRPSASRRSFEPSGATLKSPVFTDALDLAGLSLGTGSRLHRSERRALQHRESHMVAWEGQN